MRGLIVLCLAAVALASPQYSYDQGGAGSIGSGSIGSGSIGSGGGAPAPAGPAVWNKQISLWSAPEDAGEEGGASSGSSLSNQKSLRIVIIKTPENKGLENAALNLARSAGDQQTAIYVLNKQTDLGDLERKLAQSSGLGGNKPEVHFIKYKTPAEAEHAQHTIQNQYNSLAGPTSVSNEGPAPVQSFIGSVPSASGGSGGSGSRGGLPAYLPPTLRRF